MSVALLARALFARDDNDIGNGNGTVADSDPFALDDGEQHPTEGGSPVVAFIIGVAIVLLASLMNAAGLNLTKLDHVSESGPLWDVEDADWVQVRTSAVPKASRRKDWLRPLWLLGMMLYMFV